MSINAWGDKFIITDKYSPKQIRFWVWFYFALAIFVFAAFLHGKKSIPSYESLEVYSAEVVDAKRSKQRIEFELAGAPESFSYASKSSAMQHVWNKISSASVLTIKYDDIGSVYEINSNNGPI